jgi:hypothetical protein
LHPLSEELDLEFVMAVSCQEKRGLVLRTVNRFYPRKPDALYLLQRMYGKPSLFSNQPLQDIKQLKYLYESGWTWLLVDDVGILGVGPFSLHEGPTSNVLACDVHMTFWDMVLRGREDLVRMMAIWAADHRDARAVYTVVPSSSKAVLAFCKRVGFEIVDWRVGLTKDSKGRPDDAVVLMFPVR